MERIHCLEKWYKTFEKKTFEDIGGNIKTASKERRRLNKKIENWSWGKLLIYSEKRAHLFLFPKLDLFYSLRFL
jgi:hypothetical protein